MPYESTLSATGEVTLPTELRERLRLEPGDKITYEIEDDQAILRRAAPFDVSFHAAVAETLDEWSSPEDEEAFRDL